MAYWLPIAITCQTTGCNRNATVQVFDQRDRPIGLHCFTCGRQLAKETEAEEVRAEQRRRVEATEVVS